MRRRSLVVLSCFMAFCLSLVPSPGAATTLTVESTPDNRPVSLDGEPVGKTPHEISIDTASHTLDVRSGNRKWASNIDLSGDAELIVSLSEPSNPLTGVSSCPGRTMQRLK